MGGTSCYYGNVSPVTRIATGAARDLIPDVAFTWIMLPQIYIPIIGNIVIYSCIFVSIRKRKKVADTVTIRNGSIGRGSSKPDKMANAVTKMMCMVLGYLIFAWLPYFSLIYIYSYNNIVPFWYVYSSDVSAIFLYSNSAVNPIIYSWFHRDFQEAYKRLLKCQKAKSYTNETSLADQSIAKA
jgi:hypothetical protein